MALKIVLFIGYDKVVNILARNGADVNAPDNNGFSPIYAATQQGSLECVKGVQVFNIK